MAGIINFNDDGINGNWKRKIYVVVFTTYNPMSFFSPKCVTFYVFTKTPSILKSQILNREKWSTS